MKHQKNNLSTKARVASVIAVIAAASVAVLSLRDVSIAQESSNKGPAANETPKYTPDGQLIAFTPDVYREWVFVGTPLTPNDLNDGEASFPEFHNVYINPTAWREWKKIGRSPKAR
jgi:hypothetical protein